MDVLDKMRSFKLLEPLVFGGGTMLRLCYELNRYSADLDFWFVKETPHDPYFERFKRAFDGVYEITDAQAKHFTLLFEFRAAGYPRRLKIEIRRQMGEFDFQETIAFSRFASKQVFLKAFTLEQSMKNKVAAFLDRGEIRDGFDIEFLLRKGIALPYMSSDEAKRFRKRIDKFKELDFKVKLGSVVESDVREYYTNRKFSYLQEKMASLSSKG